VPVIRRGSDYDSADRSQGFAIEDVRFGRLATWAGLTTAKRVQIALHQQRQMAQAGGRPPPLGALLMEQKVLTKRQVEAVLAQLGAGPGSPADAAFIEAARASGFVSVDKIAACQRLQQELAESGHDAPPLPLLLYEKRFLQENQIIALLKAAEMRQAGLAYAINRDAQGVSAVDQLLGPSEERHVDKRLIAALGVAIALFLVWLAFFAGKPATATVECSKCHAIGGAPENSRFPLPCPQCSEKAMFPQAICLECGHRFPVEGVGYGSACPKCKSTRFRMITNKVKLDEIRKQIEKNKPETTR